MTLPPVILNFLLAGAILIGLLICFFGYRIFRFILAVAGFILGASFVAGFGYTLTDGNDLLVILIAGIAGGLILGALFLFLYQAGVFIIGATFGVFLFFTTSIALNIDASTLLYIAVAIVGGLLALFVQKFMIVLMTSFTGAWIAVVSVLYLISGGFDPFSPEIIDNIGDIETYRILFSWLALGVLGFVVQYLIFPKKAKEPEITDSPQKHEHSEQ